MVSRLPDGTANTGSGFVSVGVALPLPLPLHTNGDTVNGSQTALQRTSVPRQEARGGGRHWPAEHKPVRARQLQLQLQTKRGEPLPPPNKGIDSRAATTKARSMQAQSKHGMTDDFSVPGIAWNRLGRPLRQVCSGRIHWAGGNGAYGS